MKHLATVLVAFSLLMPLPPRPFANEKNLGSRFLLPVATYREKVYASWLGQMVGNVYGLGYEFKFVDEPGPDAMPYGYADDQLLQVRKVDGGFSDDDTDIEYMYLLQMEKHGIEPTYRQLADAWKYHVRERIWVANRVAVANMHAGWLPPYTGMKGYNDQWFQIDPQLINEIWAVTAPGMIDYATAKSDWAARIMADGFGVEPTIHYAAMYAAAFFESDVERLVKIGLAALPQDGRFAEAVRFVQQLVREHPDNWRAARAAVAARYYGEFDYNRGSWPAVDATLNGACGIMALLYGRGDFQHTLDMACAIGFDADNQAATMCGLLGIANGLDSIPGDLLFPLPEAGWKLPFNDRYINVSRYDMPDASLRDMAERMANQGEKIILAHGGAKLKKDGVEYYRIPNDAEFTPPFELNSPPVLRRALGETLEFPIYTGRSADDVRWTLNGDLPPGSAFKAGTLTGTPTKTGTFSLDLAATSGGETRETTVTIQIRGKNLAGEASEILFNSDSRDHDLDFIRDGNPRGRTHYSIADHPNPRTDYYGYRWDAPRKIAALRYTGGRPQEWGGWFTSLEVEYLTSDGSWQKVQGLHIDPKPNFDNSQWLKGNYISYDLAFRPIETAGIRIIGTAGGTEPDANNRHRGLRHYTAISELSVYSE